MVANYFPDNSIALLSFIGDIFVVQMKLLASKKVLHINRLDYLNEKKNFFLSEISYHQSF